jgi:hypothetical protein
MKIFYTGIGCKEGYHHNKDEFMNIMKNEFTFKEWRHELNNIGRENHYQLQYKDWVLPDDFIFFTLDNWIDYSGAEIVD